MKSSLRCQRGPGALIRQKIGRTLQLICSLLLMFATAACHRKEGGAAQSRRATGPIPVTVGKVAQQDVPSQVRAIGNVMPYSMVAVRSRVSGELTKVHFAEGHE